MIAPSSESFTSQLKYFDMVSCINTYDVGQNFWENDILEKMIMIIRVVMVMIFFHFNENWQT